MPLYDARLDNHRRALVAEPSHMYTGRHRFGSRGLSGFDSGPRSSGAFLALLSDAQEFVQTSRSSALIQMIARLDESFIGP